MPISDPLLIASIFCFLVSFFLPVAGGRIFDIRDWDAFNCSVETTFRGCEKAIRLPIVNKIPLLTKLWVNNAWLANVIYIGIIYLVFRLSRLVTPIHIVLVAIVSTIFEMYGVILSHNSDSGGFGYWASVGSFVLLSITMFKKLNPYQFED